MKLLLTAFEPFGGESVNPSALVLEQIREPKGLRIAKALLPVSFSGAPSTLLQKIDRFCPDAVLCLGQAAGRAALTPERIGINWMDASIPDNDGAQPRRSRIRPDGPDAYFSTLPAYAMADAAQAAGIPAQVSLSAGAYVCNCTLYCALEIGAHRKIAAGFVHVPCLPMQAAKKQLPSMTLEQMTAGISAMLDVLR